MLNGATHTTDNAAVQPGSPAYIRKVLNVLFEPGDVTELRCLNTRQGTISGYFNDLEKLADEAAKLSANVPAVYVTLNPVDQALLARAVNRVEGYAKATTTDKQIIKRRWFLLDLDVPRPAGISSTKAEHEAAITRAAEVKSWLETNLGFPELIIADSGNGAHLLGRIDLPCSDEITTLVKKCIEAVALRFEDAAVSVDRTVYNAARIWKLYGTMACKGDDTPERPHRPAKIIKVPRPSTIIPLEKLQKLAAMAPAEPSRDIAAHRQPFDIDAWIAKSRLDVAASGAWQDGRKWIFSVCPWNGDHTNRSAYIIEQPSGAVAAGCHHNGCSGKDWHDLRDTIEPGWRENHSGSSNATHISVTQEKSGTVEKTETLLLLSDVTPKKLQWLWHSRIPLGKLSVLDGDPGLGKVLSVSRLRLRLLPASRCPTLLQRR